jgi:orotidine-5'-phosphate decarboxylase
VLSFGRKLELAFASGGQLCLGIDPHAFLLDQWGLPDTAAGARECGLRVVDAAAGVVSIVKPQVAFFERYGSAGYAALEAVLAAARQAGLLIIADAKRGDVGSTVAAYGAAWLTPGSPLEADAMTLSAYQGLGSLTEVRELAISTGKGLFVLAATSNPESFETQTAVRDRGNFAGSTVAASIVREVDQLNTLEGRLGSVGVVIGSTLSIADYGISSDQMTSTPILAPGFGEQGALLSQVTDLYAGVVGNVIISISRSVLRAGPQAIRAELQRQSAALAEGIGKGIAR